MKKLIFYFSVLLLLSSTTTNAQNEFGIKLGVSSYDLPNSEINSSKDLKLSLNDASYGLHFGVYGRIGILGINLQPEILFNSNPYHYKLNDLTNVDSLDNIRTTKYQNLDIPVLIMLSPAFFKLYAGPVGHYRIKSISDFTSKDKVIEIFNNLKFGYQFGAGITLNGLTVDVRYEGNFSKTFKTFSIDGHEYQVDDSPSRVNISLWFKL